LRALLCAVWDDDLRFASLRDCHRFASLRDDHGRSISGRLDQGRCPRLAATVSMRAILAFAAPSSRVR
jgi:hypothetical protein